MYTAFFKLFNSMARSRGSLWVLGLLACATLAPAYALESDRSQPIDVKAAYTKVTGDGLIVLKGAVVITQGSLQAHADAGTAYSRDGKVVRMVLEGGPATFAQDMDGGGHVNARADVIEYQVGRDIIILTGHARIVQVGKGQYSGAKLVYNTGSGAISGSGGDDGRVHLILQPRNTIPASADVPPASDDAP